MKPAAFRYHAPKTLDEAVAMLAEVAPDDGRVLAGGQSLVPIMAFRLARPTHLVDINGITELAQITGRRRQARGSAPACGMRRSTSRCARARSGKLLATVVRHIAHHPIRTRGTFCGSLAHADPASEWCMVAATLDAEMVARSKRGTRIIAGQGLLRRHHDDGARRRRIADRGAAADAVGGHALRLLANSPAAPATSRSAWRS